MRDELQNKETATAAAWARESISRIPVLPLSNLSDLLGATRVWAQCEFLQPSGSHKDRVYFELIDALETSGVIEPGMTLIDYSSGNSGTSLAFVARSLGYDAVIVRPEDMSKSKSAHIAALGARLVETPAHLGVEGAIQAAKYLSEVLGDSGHLIDQGNNVHNSEAFAHAANQVCETLREKGVELNAFVCTVGTGGTFSGFARSVSTYFPDARRVAVDIEGQTALSHMYGGQTLTSNGHRLEGVSTGKVFSETDGSLIDEYVVVREDEAIEACRILWRREQLFAGLTSGANLAACAKLGTDTVLTVFFDAAWKYFSHPDLFSRPLRDKVSKFDQIADWIDALQRPGQKVFK